MPTTPKSVFDAAQLIGKALDGLSAEDKQKALNGAAVMLGLVSARESAPSDIEREAARDGAPGSGSAGTRKSGGKPKSLVEYLNDKQPATNQQRIAVFAAYREEVEGIEGFSKEDLEKCFAKAKLAPPGKNFGRDYYKAVTDGWIHDDGANSYLTQTGQKAVAAGFEGKSKPRGSAAGKAKGKKAKVDE